MPDFMKKQQPKSEINKGTDEMTLDDVKSWLSNPRGV